MKIIPLQVDSTQNKSYRFPFLNHIYKIMASIPHDPTFRSYTAEEAKAYATHRLSYPQELYNEILNYHASTGGQFGLLFDIGCGPGNATRDVALSFDEAIAADPGAAMIDAARDIGGHTKSGNDIRFEVTSAEEFSKIEELKDESVDLLTSAMAVSSSMIKGIPAHSTGALV